MKVGTIVSGQLIVDSRFLKDETLNEKLIRLRTELKNVIKPHGIVISEFGYERNLSWDDGETQIRQRFKLKLTKKMTQNQVYELVNKVYSQPLKFS